MVFADSILKDRWYRFRNIDPIPCHTHLEVFRIDSSLYDCRWRKTLVHIGLPRSHLNSCYHPQSTRTWTFSTPTTMPSYLQRAWLNVCTAVWHGWWRVSTLHIQGRSLRQVSCYTLLGGWPPSCCLESSTPRPSCSVDQTIFVLKPFFVNSFELLVVGLSVIWLLCSQWTAVFCFYPVVIQFLPLSDNLPWRSSLQFTFLLKLCHLKMNYPCC